MPHLVKRERKNGNRKIRGYSEAHGFYCRNVSTDQLSESSTVSSHMCISPFAEARNKGGPKKGSRTEPNKPEWLHSFNKKKKKNKNTKTHAQQPPAPLTALRRGASDRVAK